MTSPTAAAAELRQRAAWLRGCPALARSALARSGWTGEAATSLAEHLDRVGADLDAAADLHERAAIALEQTTWTRKPTADAGGGAGGGGSW